MAIYKRPVKRILGVIAVLLLVYLAIGGPQLVGRIGPYWTVSRRLPDLRRTARSLGLLVSADDLIRESQIPLEQNAASLYQQISHALPYRALSSSEDESVRAVTANSASPYQISQAEHVLAQHKAEITLAATAAALPDCRFPRNYALGPDLPLPEYAGISRLAKLLAARAVLQSSSPRAAFETIAILTRMAAHMEKDPMLIGDLVGIDIEALADRAWRAVVFRNASRPDVLKMAEETEHLFPPPPDLHHAFMGSVVMGEIALDHIRRTGSWGTDIIDQHIRRPPHLAIVTDAWEARQLDTWIRIQTALNVHPGDYVAASNALHATFASDKLASGRHQPTYELQTTLLGYGVETAPLKAASVEALHAGQVALLALLAFKNRTGSFPPDLASLSPPPPIDPFAHAPLQYHRQGAGFILYSVGENLKDDGGDVTRKGDAPPLDLGFAYP
jgi:hypothetical protein